MVIWWKFDCSNYDIFLTRDCLAYSKVKPVVNQIETHPYFQRDSLVKFCQKHGICITAHTPLGGAVANTEWFGTVSCLDDPVFKVSKYLSSYTDQLKFMSLLHTKFLDSTCSQFFCFNFLASGSSWEIQEDCGPDCSQVGHPTEHGCHPKDVQAWETRREF